jgi:hypothetical protein
MIIELFPIPVYMYQDEKYLDLCNYFFQDCEKQNKFATGNDGVKTTLIDYNPKKANVSYDIISLSYALPFINFIKNCAYNFLDETYFSKNYEISIENIWLNINEYKTNNTNIHNHYGYTFSGCYYVSVPENSGIITFMKENTFNHTLNIIEEYTTSNSPEWNLSVNEGTVIIFPSYLKHYVPSRVYCGTRKSIAFDLTCI